jgi:hypothetical protein
MADKVRGKGLKRKRKSDEAGEGADASNLRLRGDPREERRYEPKASAGAIVSMIVASLAAVSVGAGTYAQWLRPEDVGPHKYAFAMLAAGSAALIGVFLFGLRTPKVVRVGDAGIGIEKDGNEIERIAWCDVQRVTVVSGSVLTFQSSGNSVAISIPEQPQAAARAMEEARARIPSKVEGLEPGSLPAVDANQGEVIALDPPQAAGLRCKKSDKLIAFERDARFCGRCGELYHKDSVPKLCLTCRASL